MQITSLKNRLLKEVRRAAARGTLTAEGLCLAESPHLLEEAVRSGCEVPVVIASESAELALDAGASQIVRLPERLFGELSTTENPQGVLALVRPRSWRMDDLIGPKPLVVVLDGVQDPGNAGTIVRTAEAFGGTGVIFVKGSVNPHNPKTVRASAGSVFRVPLLAAVEEAEALEAILSRGIALYAAMPRASMDIAQADLGKGCALVIGSEGHGVGSRFAAASTGVRIGTAGVESLNAAIAAAVILYEARRQRQGAG